MMFLSIFVNLNKIAICSGVLLMYWFLVMVLNGRYPGLLGVATGVKGVYCSFGSFWWVVAFNKPHKIEISHSSPKVYA